MQSVFQSRRVLVVDDNFEVARTFFLSLRDIGHEVEFAVNAYAAIEIARRFHPEIVLLDLGLPDLDGCELARILRRQPGLERARIMAVTGRGGDESRQRAVAAGFDEYLMKPLDPGLLERLLEPSPPSRPG